MNDIETICKDVDADMNQFVNDIGDIFTILSNEYMCSEACPCIDVDWELWNGRSDLS